MNANGTKYNDVELAQLKAEVDLADLEVNALGSEGCFNYGFVMSPEQQSRMDKTDAIFSKWFQRFNP